MGEKKEKDKEKEKKEKALLKKPEALENADAPMEQQVAALLMDQGLTVTTAESLTGGLISAALTSVPGMSQCFKLGFVTYSNKAKKRVLSVKKDTLRKEGAVSAQCAKEMAIGALMESEADLSIAVTGNAGPDAMEEKPVGLVYIAVCVKGKTKVTECHFEGDRREIREKTTDKALEIARDMILDRFV